MQVLRQADLRHLGLNPSLHMGNSLEPLHLNSSERLIKLPGEFGNFRIHKGQTQEILQGDQKIPWSLRRGTFWQLLLIKSSRRLGVMLIGLLGYGRDSDNAMKKYSYPIEQSRGKLPLEIALLFKPKLMTCA